MKMSLSGQFRVSWSIFADSASIPNSSDWGPRQYNILPALPQVGAPLIGRIDLPPSVQPKYSVMQNSLARIQLSVKKKKKEKEFE
jgi:hypothetical protein